MFVVNADQARSRSSEDLIPAALSVLEALPLRPALGFERTVGDEIQGVLASGADVVAACRALAEVGEWHVAVGLGTVQRPYPASTRAARGGAFLAARRAAEEVKGRAPSVLVVGQLPATTSDPEALDPNRATVDDADTALGLLATIWRRRTDGGWAAVQATERVRAKDSKAALSTVAKELGISHQALSQRLRSADWELETKALGTVARLLDRADAAVAAATQNPTESEETS
ncbi:MAG: hypothetical protein ACTIJJ_13355 [Galactobacter sp.]|uniref:hypothetical protein n=1 Tax=Galactobacter sp. TaxID=2676125 RepID=UPI0025C1DFBE|nr:hypothetical protein [Galactobacter sp.]